MANFIDPADPAFPAVYKIALDDDVLAGDEGVANRQAKQLAERTAYLKKNLAQETADREESDDDLQDQIDANAGKINAVKGRGGYLMAYDFGTHTPSQEELTDYALSQIHSDDPVDIWNGTHVKNTYVDPATVDDDYPDGRPDNHVWVLTNTPDTDPPIFEWTDDGFDSISDFGNGIAGTIRGVEDLGDGSKRGFITAAGNGQGKVIGDFLGAGQIFSIGDFFVQLPDASSPVEKGLPGDWEPWSGRAVMYGVSQAPPPSYVDYSSKVATAIAAGTTPVVCYHKPGDDYRLYQFISQTAAYTVPDEFDPVKWTALTPGVIDARQKCGNALSDEDYEIGDQISSGSYQDFYVCEILVLGGKFPSVEGGFRPTYISGGVQPGRIPNIEGILSLNTSAGGGGTSSLTSPSTGPFVSSGVTVTGGVMDTGAGWVTPYGKRAKFSAAAVVRTGPDVSPANLAARYWRLVSL
jgi:hypothetical protein